MSTIWLKPFDRYTSNPRAEAQGYSMSNGSILAKYQKTDQPQRGGILVESHNTWIFSSVGATSDSYKIIFLKTPHQIFNNPSALSE